METIDAVTLFVHIAAVMTAFGAGLVGHVALFRMKAARDTATLREWMAVVPSVQKATGAGTLLIILSGAQLVHRLFDWGDGWVMPSLVCLVLIEVAAGALLGGRMKTLDARVAGAADGPVPTELRALVVDPALWTMSHAITGLVLAIVYVMIDKPSTVGSVAVIVAGALVGALTALPFVREGTASQPA